MQLHKELSFRSVTRKEKIHVYPFHGLHAPDSVLRSRIDYTVSGFRRVMFFCIVEIGVTSRVRGRYFNIRRGTCRIRNTRRLSR